MAKMLVLFWLESLCMIVRLKSLVELKNIKIAYRLFIAFLSPFSIHMIASN